LLNSKALNIKVFSLKSNLKQLRIKKQGDFMPEVKLLPLAAMEKIIKKVGVSDIRVSDKAKTALKNIIEERAEEIAGRAWQLASHAGRKTVKASDIKLAVNR